MPIRALTMALANLLQASLANQPGIPANAFKVQVTPPNGESAKSDLVLFLYRITPNAELRNADRLRRFPDPDSPLQRFEPAVPLDLHYLVTVGATAADRELALARLTSLGDAIRAIEAASPIALPAVFQEAVWLSLEPMSTDDLARIWGLFPNEICRSSFAFRASPVWIDPRTPGPPGPPVVADRADAGRLLAADRPTPSGF
jgi:hypothetical protein